jgi:hypothetical protein
MGFLMSKDCSDFNSVSSSVLKAKRYEIGCHHVGEAIVDNILRFNYIMSEENKSIFS